MSADLQAPNRFMLESCRDGTFTLRDRECNQSMHSTMGAWAEAQVLYAGPTTLDRPLAILDVGLGIATNPIALIERWRAAGSRQPLRILSIESVLDGLRSALSQPERFARVEHHRDLLETLLRDRRVVVEHFSWELWEGDVREFSQRGWGADFVYFDMYAPAAAPELWTSTVFSEIRLAGAPGHRLITYSAARSVRDALREAGYLVARGPATPLKRETTVAVANEPAVTA